MLHCRPTPGHQKNGKKIMEIIELGEDRLLYDREKTHK
jgi:hypothetical protein